jgi:AraC-like DNA-binding protein
LGIPGVQQLGWYNHAEAHAELSFHHHDGGLEICYLERGHQSYRVGGRTYELRGGDCYVVFPNEMHDSAGRPQEKSTLYWIVLDCSRSDGPLGLLPAPESTTLRNELTDLSRRHFAIGDAPRSILDRLLTATLQRGPLWRVRASTGLSDFLLEVIDAAQQPPDNSASSLVRELVEYIDANLDRRLDLRELSARCGLSQSRLKTRFRLETGIPPAEFVLRRKIEAACTRLRDETVAVTRIALDLGFSSSQYFATVFGRYMRTTPSDYRRTSGAGKPERAPKRTTTAGMARHSRPRDR